MAQKRNSNISSLEANRMDGMEFAIPDSLEDEIQGIFDFNQNLTHQQRAHDYLKRRRIVRHWNIPATMAAVRDLVGRAYNLGMSEMGNQRRKAK